MGEKLLGPIFLSSRYEVSMGGELDSREELLDFSRSMDWGKGRQEERSGKGEGSRKRPKSR